MTGKAMRLKRVIDTSGVSIICALDHGMTAPVFLEPLADIASRTAEAVAGGVGVAAGGVTVGAKTGSSAVVGAGAEAPACLARAARWAARAAAALLTDQLRAEAPQAAARARRCQRDSDRRPHRRVSRKERSRG